MAKPGEVIRAPPADAPLKEGEIPTSSEIALGDDEKTTPVPDEDDIVAEVRTITGFKWFLACLAMFSANLLYGLDTTIVADIQAAVAETYDDITKLGWLGIGFMLGSVAFILPLGKAYAVFDTKWLFLGCLTMFAAASALCGAAPSMNAIIIGRIWAGAGGAGMYLGNINYITTITTPSEQPVYIGMIGLSFGSGLILGPVVGGLFSDSTLTWRWAFYINLLIFGAMTPLYFFVLPSKPRRPGTTFVQRLKSIDILGVLLNAGMYVSFVLFCTFGGSTWSWSDGRTIACIIIFVILLVSFAITQIYCVWTTHDDRLFPCEMVFDRTLVLLFVCTAASSSCIFVTIYYVPLYFQFVNNDSGTQSAIRLLPFVSFYFATVYCCGRFMGQTGYFILWFIASGIFLTIGGALMYTVKFGTHVANIYGYTILTALGTATSQAAYALAPTMVTPNRIPEAIQFMNIAQCGSLLLALTIANAIFQNGVFDGLRKIFEPLGHSDKDISGAVAGARSTLLTGSSTAVRREALDVIIHTTDNVYLMVVAGGALFLICSCLLPRKR